MRPKLFAAIACAALCSLGAIAPASADLFGYKSPGMHPDLDGLKGPKPVEDDFVRYGRKGFGSIKGHLGIADTTQNGNEIILAHEIVYLVPATPYTKWYFMDYLTKDLKRAHMGIYIEPRQDRLKFVPLDPIAVKYTRKFETDADGHFQFTNLPTGQYYVIAFGQTELTGSNVSGGLLGYQVSNYKAQELYLLADDPPLDINGDRPGDSSALVRIVPSVRVQTFCAVGTKLTPCNQVIDLDQFLGGQGEY